MESLPMRHFNYAINTQKHAYFVVRRKFGNIACSYISQRRVHDGLLHESLTRDVAKRKVIFSIFLARIYLSLSLRREHP